MSNELKGILQPKTFNFEWKIEGFLDDNKKIGDFYCSPSFMVPYEDESTEWFMKAYPKGDNEESKGYVSLWLCLVKDDERKIPIDFQFSITNKSFRAFGSRFQNSLHYGAPKFIEQIHCLTDDPLTIQCRITFHPSNRENVEFFHGYDEWLDNIQNRLDDYEKLLESDSFADVTFNIEDKQIKAHKAILSCRSPIFKAIFEHGIKEDTVDVTDIDYVVMKELCRFLYSGKVNDIETLASDLLYAADKYCVMGLKALCETTLYEKITVDNALEYLKLTSLCDTIDLKNLVIDFIAANYKVVIKKPGFADLDKDIMFEIMLAVAEKD